MSDRQASRREAILIAEGLCPLCDELGHVGEVDAVRPTLAVCQRCEAEFERTGDWPEEEE